MLSSTGFSMDVHYCKNKVKNVSFFSKAKTCNEKQNKCTQNNAENIVKSKCCHSESLLINNSDLNEPANTTVTPQNVQLSFIYAFVTNFIVANTQEVNYPLYKQYSPPLNDKDVQTLYQTFLI